MIDGINLHQVTLVGLVRSAKESSTNLSYEIDDMTGPFLEVRQFVDNDENTPEAEKVALVRENIYVRVHGHVRAFGGKRNVAAFRVVPLTDMNELTSHLLEVIYAHAYWTKDHSATRGATSHMGNSMMNTTRSGFDTSSNFGGQVDVGLTAQQQQVLNVIRSCVDEQGLAMAVVCDRLKGMPLKVVRDAVEFLSSEGHIYSTIDDEHYKATDSM
jgi:replication factor A2